MGVLAILRWIGADVFNRDWGKHPIPGRAITNSRGRADTRRAAVVRHSGAVCPYTAISMTQSPQQYEKYVGQMAPPFAWPRAQSNAKNVSANL